jgi:hypothetical protein
MRYLDIIKDPRFQDLFDLHCIAYGRQFVSNSEAAKRERYFSDESQNSKAFNDYLKKSYVFYRTDELVLGVDEGDIFLIDNENSLFLIGKNPLMLVNVLASDECHYGFDDIKNMYDFNLKYCELFGKDEMQLTANHIRDFFGKINFY